MVYCFKIIKRHAKQISMHQIWPEDNHSTCELSLYKEIHLYQTESKRAEV